MGNKMVVAAGKELLVFDPDDVRKALKRKFILAPYGVYFDRVKGVVYMVRRELWRFWE